MLHFSPVNFAKNMQHLALVFFRMVLAVFSYGMLSTHNVSCIYWTRDNRTHSWAK